MPGRLNVHVELASTEDTFKVTVVQMANRVNFFETDIRKTKFAECQADYGQWVVELSRKLKEWGDERRWLQCEGECRTELLVPHSREFSFDAVPAAAS